METHIKREPLTSIPLALCTILDIARCSMSLGVLCANTDSLSLSPERQHPLRAPSKFSNSWPIDSGSRTAPKSLQ